jgi:transcriptional regulator with XRE-family HTH domain
MIDNGERKSPSLPALKRLAKTLGVPVTALLEWGGVAMPELPSDPPVTLPLTAKDLKLAEARQVAARDDIAKGRASVARARAAITRGREILVRRAKAGELDPVLAPIRANLDAAEADLNAALDRLHAAEAQLAVGQRRLDEAREQARGAKARRAVRASRGKGANDDEG